MIGKILRAALARPWEIEDDDEYESEFGVEIANDGAPGETEFRVSPDGRKVAMWIKSDDSWVIFENVVVLQTFRAVDPGTLQDWTRYLEVEEVD